MLSDKITAIFVAVDEFCKEFEFEIIKHGINAAPGATRNRKCALSDSEFISILILFHIGQFTNFKAFIATVFAHI